MTIVVSWYMPPRTDFGATQSNSHVSGIPPLVDQHSESDQRFHRQIETTGASMQRRNIATSVRVPPTSRALRPAVGRAACVFKWATGQLRPAISWATITDRRHRTWRDLISRKRRQCEADGHCRWHNVLSPREFDWFCWTSSSSLWFVWEIQFPFRNVNSSWDRRITIFVPYSKWRAKTIK